MKKIGYIRISSKEQNSQRQFAAMEEYGIEKKNIYVDQMSGQNFCKPEYMKMLRKLRKGDLLVVQSIDRLGRNYAEILEQWRKLTTQIQVDIEVIDMPLLNTNLKKDDLTGTFIADLVLQILAYVAETERIFIRQRQAEGIAAAKSRGVKFGREKKNLPCAFEEYYSLWSQGELSIRQAAEKAGMSPSTFYRRCKERK